jgi:hypothetical protein
MARRLWRRFGSEPYLINPHLISLNPKKGVKKMAKTKKRHYKRNAPKTRNVLAFNRPKRRHYRRHNPAMFGGGSVLGMNLKDVGFAGGGFLAVPFLEGLTHSFIPASISGTTIGKYGVKIGIVAGLTYAAKKFIGPEAGKYVGIGGAVFVLGNMVLEFAPMLFSGGFSGGMGRLLGAQTSMNPGRMFPRTMGSQPYLGRYTGPGQSRASIAVPARLDPGSRF